ncbi:protein MOS2-like [Silene latifolia]|uniref:protein MOS2-like n=1 Tax=Silene latifolia TaxID=37657 RepID=UPI003D785D3B
MKLQSFALQSKSNSKPKPSKNFADSSSSQFDSSKTPEFVSEFDPSSNPNSAPKKTIIIPPKENEWRPHKKMKNLELPPLHSGNKPLDFELEDADIVAANDSGASMSFGLNLRQSNGKIDEFKSSSSSNGGSSIDAIMIRQFKSDLENLPEEQGFDEYDDMPVDGFGAALLAGYGWREGRGIGKNARDDVKLKKS